MANKPSNESKKPIEDEDLKATVAGHAHDEPRKGHEDRHAATPTPLKPAVAGYASYTVPGHLGSATVTGPDGKQVVLAGGQTGTMTAAEAARIGATPEGAPPLPRSDGRLDEHGSTRADQLPQPVKPAEKPVKGKAAP